MFLQSSPVYFISSTFDTARHISIAMIRNKILEGPPFGTVLPPQTLGQLLFDRAGVNADKICQVDGTTDDTETFGSLRLRSIRVALALRERGITHNDVIAFCAPNSIDTAVPIIAAFYLGAKVANLEPTLSIRQTQHLVSLVHPKIVFVEEGSVALIEESLKAANCESDIVVLGEAKEYPTLAQLAQPREGEDSFKPAEVNIHEVAVMFFSSGTTGMPKAISHSHYSFINMGVTMCDLHLGDGVLHFTTFYWITAMIMLLYSHMAGGRRIFCRSFDPEITLRTIEKYKVTTAFMAPVLAYKLVNCKNAKNYNTSSLRIVQCGGTQVNPTHFQELVRLFKHSHVMNVYGMSEIGYISSFDFKIDSELIKSRPTSSGKPISGISLKVVDPDTNELLGPNQKGEIRLKTICMMKGYYEADSSFVLDEEGFLKSGDVGYYDEDGCVYVVTRIKEMFKYQSWHIVPSALEAVLLEHPAVKEAAVFGVPAGEDGEAPGACVVLDEGQSATEEEIFNFVANKVSDREKLRGGITFIKDLPKTPTGKVIRREITDLIAKAK